MHYTVSADTKYIYVAVDGDNYKRYNPGGYFPGRFGKDGQVTYTLELGAEGQYLTPGKHTLKTVLEDERGNRSPIYTHELTYIKPGDAAYVDDSINQTLAHNTRRIDSNTQGIANVTAMASMPALPAGAESGFTAGVGAYSGKNALALGFQHRLNANTALKVAVATGSTGKATVGAGVSYSWGGPSQPVPGQSQQVVALQDQLRAQGTTIAAQDARMAAQDARIEALMAQVAQLASK